MTQEDKELLLKDLCARLSYGIFVKENRHYSLDDSPVIYTYDYHPCISNCKPYLRPMSSMTEEECIELGNIKATIENISEVIPNVPYYIEVAYSEQIDWLNAHHFDYRGLIEKGLALESLEGMYKTWNSLRGNLKEDNQGNIVGGLKL